MRNQLKSILLAALEEKLGSNDELVVSVITTFGELLLPNATLFAPVPRRLHGWVLPKLEFNSTGHNNNQFVFEPFGPRGVLLHDSMHAATAGGYRAMYRAKGVRLYLFEDGNMKLMTPYCTIDEEYGFALENESWDVTVNINGRANPFWVREMLHSIYGDANNPEPRFVCRDVLRLLCNIRQPFTRTFLIEYVLTPPDVDALSDFSRTCTSTLWDICLSRSFEDEVGSQRQSQCIEVLSQCAGSPAASLLLSFLRESTVLNNDLAKMLARMDQLEQGLTGKLQGISSQLPDTAYWSALLRPSVDIQSGFGGRKLSLQEVKIVVTTMLKEFKALVENQGLWKELWEDDERPRREQSAQRLFYAMATSYCKANNLDITPEANNGVGPVDFKFSSGFHARFLVEAKLSTNDALVHGYTTQLEAYKAAESTEEGVLLVVDVGGMGGKLGAVKAVQLAAQKANKNASEVFYVDGRRKQSASVRSVDPGKNRRRAS